MVNYDRGIYEPSDEVRVFDGSEEEEDIEGSRLPLLIVLALIVLFAFGGVVYFAYSQGVARGRGETPVLVAQAGPERIAPQSPGGANVPYQGFKIYQQPAPPDDQADAAAPAAAAPAPRVAQNPAPPVRAAEVAPARPVEKPVAAPPPPAKGLATQPAAATGAPRRLGGAVPAPVVAAPNSGAASPAAQAGAGSYVLQIGAYKTQAEADAAWKRYKAAHAALLGGFAENTQQVDLGAKGEWIRLRVAGFPDKDVATATCERLKADGGACFLGR